MPRPPCKSLEEIAAWNTPTIRPSDVASVLGCSPYLINVQFKLGEKPFDGYMSGNRVLIFRVPFLKRMGYTGQITA